LAVSHPDFRSDPYLTVPIVDPSGGALLNIFSTKNLSKADLHATASGTPPSPGPSPSKTASRKPLGFIDFARFVFVHKDTPIQQLLDVMHMAALPLGSASVDPVPVPDGDDLSRDSMSPPFSPPFKRTYTEGVANLNLKPEHEDGHLYYHHLQHLHPLTNPRPVPGMMGMASLSSDDWSESIESVTSSEHPSARRIKQRVPPHEDPEDLRFNLANVKSIVNPRPVPGMGGFPLQASASGSGSGSGSGLGLGGSGLGLGSLNSISTSTPNPHMLERDDHEDIELSPRMQAYSAPPFGRFTEASPPSSPPIGYTVPALSNTDNVLNHVVSEAMTIKQVIQRMIDCHLQTIVYVRANVVVGTLSIAKLLQLVLNELTTNAPNEF